MGVILGAKQRKAKPMDFLWDHEETPAPEGLAERLADGFRGCTGTDNPVAQHKLSDYHADGGGVDPQASDADAA